MHAIAIIKKSGGSPVIAAADPPYTNWVSMGDLPAGFGLYLVSDTPARLLAADDLPGVYGICALTRDGDIIWAELDNVITPAARTKLNTWLTARGLPAIPADWTNKQVVVEMLHRINSKFKLEDFWVKDIAD